MGAEFSVEHPATADPPNQNHSESSRYVAGGKPVQNEQLLDRPVIQDLMTWSTSLSSCVRSCFSFGSSTLPASGIISEDSILWSDWRNMHLQGMKRDTIPAEGARTRVAPSSPISMRVLWPLTRQHRRTRNSFDKGALVSELDSVTGPHSS